MVLDRGPADDVERAIPIDLALRVSSSLRLLEGRPTRAQVTSDAHRRGEQSRVTVVVLTRDSSRTIVRCLKSLPADADVLVVDSGSTDETVRLVEEFERDISIMHIAWVGDFAAARNAAIAAVSSGFILFVDSDEFLSAEARVLVLPAVKMLEANFVTKGLAIGLSILDKGGSSTYPVGRGLWKEGGLRFSGAVHERLVSRDGSEPAVCVVLSSLVFHSGYGDGELDGKLARNQRILVRAVRRGLGDLFSLYFFERDFIGRAGRRRRLRRGRLLRASAPMARIGFMGCPISGSWARHLDEIIASEGALEAMVQYRQLSPLLRSRLEERFSYAESLAMGGALELTSVLRRLVAERLLNDRRGGRREDWELLLRILLFCSDDDMLRSLRDEDALASEMRAALENILAPLSGSP